MMAAYVFIVFTSLVTAFVIDKVTGLLVFIGFAGIPFLPVPGIVLFVCCLVLILYKQKLDKQRDQTSIINSKEYTTQEDDQLFMLSEEELEKFFEEDKSEENKNDNRSVT